MAQLVKNLPAIWETWVQSLGWEDPLEKGTATHSNIMAWRIPWTISPSNEYSGLISYRMDWFDLLVVQGTLKSLLQHYSSKASILHSLGPHGLCSAWNSPGQNMGVGSCSLL